MRFVHPEADGEEYFSNLQTGYVRYGSCTTRCTLLLTSLYSWEKPALLLDQEVDDVIRLPPQDEMYVVYCDNCGNAARGDLEEKNVFATKVRGRRERPSTYAHTHRVQRKHTRRDKA